MKLYDCQMAPNPRRVRVFLAEKGVDIPKTEVSIIKGENLKPEYLAVNPRGLLPTLELDDGNRIDETIAICRYIEETQPEPNLMGRDALEKAQIESWQRHMEFDGLNPTGEMFRNSFEGFKNRGLPGLENVQAIPELAARGKAGVERFMSGWNTVSAREATLPGSGTPLPISPRCVWSILPVSPRWAFPRPTPTPNAGMRTFPHDRAPRRKRSVIFLLSLWERAGVRDFFPTLKGAACPPSRWWGMVSHHER